ncbi:MAG: hypothetical protein ABIS14_07340 [Sphingomonas sp.]
MTEQLPPSRPGPESNARIDTAAAEAVDRAEAAATRRRWITLAEFVAVAGLLVAVASLWLSWSDRRSDTADKQAEKAEVSKTRTQVTLAGAVSSDGETITLKDDAHQLRDVQVIFPTPLGVSVQSGTFGPKIAASWFADKLVEMTKNGPAKRIGRLPVILSAAYWDGEVVRTDRAIYDIGWQIDGRFLGIVRGRKLRMHSLTLRNRSGTQAKLDAAWGQEKPAG